MHQSSSSEFAQTLHVWSWVFGGQNYEIKKGGHRTYFPGIQVYIRLNFFFGFGVDWKRGWLDDTITCCLIFVCVLERKVLDGCHTPCVFYTRIPNFKMAACFSNHTFERAFGLATFFLTSGFFKFWLRKREICKLSFHYKKSIGHRLRFHTSQFFPTLPPFSNKEKRV